MEGPFLTGIRIHFEVSELPCDILVRVAAAVERAAAAVERDEIEFLNQHFPEHAAPLDAARYRLQSYEGAAVVIERAESGSIILAGVLAGLAYWILDNTLSETLKEAWTNSSLHDRLVDLLSGRRHLRAQKMVDQLETDASLRQGRWPVRLHVTVVLEDIHIYVHPVRNDVPGPSHGSTLRRFP